MVVRSVSARIGLGWLVVAAAGAPTTAWPPAPASPEPAPARSQPSLIKDPAAALHERFEVEMERIHLRIDDMLRERGSPSPVTQGNFGIRIPSLEPVMPEPDGEVGDGAGGPPIIDVPMPPQSTRPWGVTPKCRIRNFICTPDRVIGTDIIEVEAYIIPISAP